MTTYRVTMNSGYEWFLHGDFEQAAASLRACFDDPEDNYNWQCTPYQVAAASHNEDDAAKLVYDYWRDADDDDAVDVVNPEENVTLMRVEE